MTRLTFLFRLFLSLLMLFPASLQAAEGQLVFTCPAESPENNASALVLREAYAQLDLAIQFNPLPPARAFKLANAGEADGEMARIAGIERLYPNLVRVPVVINRINLVAYRMRMDAREPASQWLVSPHRRLGCQQGGVAIDMLSKKMGFVCEPIIHSDAALEMLMMGRIDALVLPEPLAMRILAENPDWQAQLERIVLNQIDLYHYLHKSRQDLLEPITSVLTEMQNQGRIEELIAGAEQTTPIRTIPSGRASRSIR